MKHAREDYNRIQDPANLIPEHEPVFLLRGQDKLAIPTIRAWIEAAYRAHVSPQMIGLVEAQERAIIEWQENYGAKVPDLPPSLGALASTEPDIPHQEVLNRLMMKIIEELDTLGIEDWSDLVQNIIQFKLSRLHALQMDAQTELDIASKNLAFIKGGFEPRPS